MYVPAAFAEHDRATLFDLMERHSFGLLISQHQGEPFASHLPLLIDRRRGENGFLVGHMARANPQWQQADGQVILAVFSGPHAYISPTWYESENVVPTWNYAAVHVYGKPRASEDRDFTTAALSALVTKYENTRATPWRMEGLADDVFGKLASAIVAFEMPIDRIEGKFKLGQNRSREDRLGTLQGLDAEGSPNADALAEFIREHAKVDGEQPAR